MRGLGDQELKELFARLDVSEDWAVGFFAALVSGPDTIEPRAWMRYVVRDGALDDDRALMSVATLNKVRDAVALALHADASDVCPAPEDEEGIREFASGYVRGARLHPTWRAEATDLAPLAILAGEEDERADVKALRADLVGAYVAAAFARWRPQPVKAEKKIARNDPCPCGSGKKYKKCCGA